jgi:hypothetical protein
VNGRRDTATRGRTRPRRGETVAWAALAATASIVLLWAWNWQLQINDWAAESAGPLAALLHGHLSTFLSTAPPYGASLLLRAPFALPASLTHGTELLVYRLAALPCALALAALGVWLARESRRGGAGLVAAGVTVLLCTANPIAFKALVFGHPEELAGAALCSIAVLAAARGRANWAALALGVAIANKQWAILAVGPVLIALPAHRWRTLILAGAVTGVLEAPIFLATGGGVTNGTSRVIVNSTGTVFYPWQIWWFLGTPGHWRIGMGPLTPPGFRIPPGWIVGRAHELIVWLSLPATLLAAYRGLRRADALLLLALLLLMRCWLDPWDNIYYPLSFIVALLTWEAAVAHRFPVGAAAATAATWLIFDVLPHHLDLNLQSLSFTVPATISLAALGATIWTRRGVRVGRTAPAGVSRARAVPS